MNTPNKDIPQNVLKRYLSSREAITKNVDRIVAVTHLLSLLRHCDGVVEIDTHSLATVADLIDQDACCIQEVLDEFICIQDAEEALDQ